MQSLRKSAVKLRRGIQVTFNHRYSNFTKIPQRISNAEHIFDSENINKQSINDVLGKYINDKVSWNKIPSKVVRQCEAIVSSNMHQTSHEDYYQLIKDKQAFYSELRLLLEQIASDFDLIENFNEFSNSQLGVDCAVTHENKLIGFIVIDSLDRFDENGELLCHYKTMEQLYKLRYPYDKLCRIRYSDIKDDESRSKSASVVTDSLIRLYGDIEPTSAIRH